MTTPRFFPNTAHSHFIPAELLDIAADDDELRVEYSPVDDTTAFVLNQTAFAFAPEHDSDGSLDGWSWAEWEYDSLDERWHPMSGGDGSIGHETDTLERHARAWLDLAQR